MKAIVSEGKDMEIFSSKVKNDGNLSSISISRCVQCLSCILTVGEQKQANLKVFSAAFQSIFDSIMASADAIPAQIRIICHIIWYFPLAQASLYLHCNTTKCTGCLLKPSSLRPRLYQLALSSSFASLMIFFIL